MTENVCMDDVPENPSAIQTIQIDGYSIPHARALLGAAGQELTLSIGKEGVPQRDLVAKFQLPPDAVALQTMAESCLQAQSSREEAEAKATLVSCPATPDAELTEAQVLTGAGMKPFAPDADNDIGTAWYLPKSTKQHPVRPRMNLVCLYKKANGSAVRQIFPIPPKANDCVARHDDEAGNLFARCE
ncbi:MAG TPA: hypothetical protein VKV02_12855 [Acidobacteriaceae bacterium]|nr:hypothetical protein [Acidobacteriaceae bacterium]